MTVEGRRKAERGGAHLEQRQQQRFGGRHGMRQPGMLGGLGLDDFYRYQAPLFRQRP